MKAILNKFKSMPESVKATLVFASPPSPPPASTI